jgi:hypothetical protein
VCVVVHLQSVLSTPLPNVMGLQNNYRKIEVNFANETKHKDKQVLFAQSVPLVKRKI